MIEKVEDKKEKMGKEEMAVLCNDVLLYMHEHDVSLKKAYEEKKVPKEMRIDIFEMIRFLKPSKF